MEVVRERMNTDEWICLYHISDEKISYNLLKGFIECTKGYGIKFKNKESNWIPIKSLKITDWINIVQEELNIRKTCKFVIFILNSQTNKLYTDLKRHSLCIKGYVSQVIKRESIMRAINSIVGPKTFFSKILLQVNCKLGGFNYFLNFDGFIEQRSIMLIGVDSSHIWGTTKNQRTAVGMIATKDKKFSKFYHKLEFLREDSQYTSETRRNIYYFIEETFTKYYKENGDFPKNIIIYRQGISFNQLKHIKLEVKLIEETCNKLKLNYYYVLINTNTNIRFFEVTYNKKYYYKKINQQLYKNPEQGTIIFNTITNKNKFEFYIYPHEVNMGTTIPTYFHVAFGNMDFPELLINLSYWTTYLYPNWQNSIKVPHVIKLAEKLAYMGAKYTRSELNKSLSDSLSFL